MNWAPALGALGRRKHSDALQSNHTGRYTRALRAQVARTSALVNFECPQHRVERSVCIEKVKGEVHLSRGSKYFVTHGFLQLE